MTDKEQMICKYKFQDKEKFSGKPYCTCFNELCEDLSFVCDHNCQIYEDYKQLARKTQECEELKEKIKQIRNFRDKVISQLKEKNEKLKAESFTSDELISIQEKDIDRYLKALEGIERIATTFRARESSYHNVLDIISKAKENKQWD